MDTGLRMKLSNSPDEQAAIVRATIAWDYDKSDAKIHGVNVPGELYDACDELLRSDLLKALPYELRGLKKKDQTGRQLLAAAKISCKSKTREVNRIEKRRISDSNGVDIRRIGEGV